MRLAVCRILFVSLAVAGLSGCQALMKLDKEVETWGPEGSGLQFRNLGKAVKILATYKATPAQMKIAEDIARKAQAELEAEQAAKPTEPKPEPNVVESVAVEAPEGIKPPPQAPEVATSKPKLPDRYLAVQVPAKEGEAGAQGKENVLFWDTQTEQIVGEDVYVIDQPPKVGSVTKWDTFSAKYVGAGL